MAAGDVATVFLEMSLGTRLAVSFPASSTTVADLKRRVSHEHAACFPHLGQIAVQSIKIEHGGSWFHLADSMAVRDAFLFQGINERWHLQVDASLQVDQGMVTQGHSGGADSANHSAPAPGRGHGCEGSSSRRCRKTSSSDEMLPDQVEAEAQAQVTPSEREQPLTGKGEGSSDGQNKTESRGHGGEGCGRGPMLVKHQLLCQAAAAAAQSRRKWTPTPSSTRRRRSSSSSSRNATLSSRMGST
uniref:Uncharacterized protein n=1 Tax=Triticum urartu TaxID=4572 RepID=A0A8R7UKX6_TRIUA